MPLTPLKSRTAYQGQIIRVIETTMSDGRVFEKATRSPGTRTIVHDTSNNKILLNKEHRRYINDESDLRLPGGKVRDRIEEWDKIKNSPDLHEMIADAARKEIKEEAALEAKNIQLFTISPSGGPTIEWTMYYFVVNDFKQLEQQVLDVGEEIVPQWFSIHQTIDACLTGKVKEGRSAAAILQYLHSIGKI
ncbi:NUDIX domain-containing protein [Candidatus Woesebacteria bacterium]|nr:NUDIX domain-containing protein [Candidatus Woesebacteria bacterium]